MLNINNQQYWERRALDDFLKVERGLTPLLRDIAKNTKLLQQKIDTTIKDLYSKLANGGINFENANSPISLSQLEEFKNRLRQKLLERQKLGLKITNEQKTLMQARRVTKLQEANILISTDIQNITQQNKTLITEKLKNSYTQSFELAVFNNHQRVGVAIDFNLPNTRAINVVINKDFNGSNFSQRIWRHADNLEDTISQSLQQQIVLGQPVQVVAQNIANATNTNFNNAERLARTELNRVYNEATIVGYSESQVVAQYMILAKLDNRTSDICIDMDNKVFNLDDYEVGVTAPPFHPNCRSTTIPVLARNIERLQTRAKELKPDITFEDWKEEFM